MSLINYQGDSKLLKRICQLLKVTDVQDGEGHSLVDSDGIAVVTGGGGGSSTLAGLSDVDVTGASDGNVLALNGTSGKWEDKGLANVATSGSYNDLSNKPTIPAAQVNSDWSASSGVAQILNKPTALSSFTNDQGFITSSVNNLTNYYLKSETYTKTEVNTLIGQISTISILVVQSLPTTDIQTNIIYLVPKSTAGTSNAYDEYINTDGTSAGWELIGDTEVDLSNYYTKSEVDTLIGSVSGGHTIKNDSGTALAQKDNLKFAGTYSSNVGDDSVVNIVRTVNSESAITQMSAAEKKGIIVVDDGQAEEIDAYDVPYGNSDVGTALDGKINTSDIVDNLTTNDATKPLSAKQGKVLKEVYTRVGSVVRPDSTYTTLLSYINGYVVSLDRQEYTFACEGFSDMPRTDWSYDCTVTRGVGLTARIHRALSNDEDWIREISYNGQWADSWRRVFYDDNLWAVGNLLANHYQGTADAWTTNIQIADDVTKYGFLGFSYHMGNISQTNNLCRVFIPTADFVNSTTSAPIPIVLDPYNPQDSTCVYVCYVNNTTIGVYRGSGVNQWLRLFMVGYFKR